MSYSTDNFQVVLDSFQLGADSPLDLRTVRRAFAEAECDFGSQEHTIFNRETTLWAFLYEMLHTGPQRTLQTAVLAVRQLRIARGLDPNSPNTGTYAAARAKIDVVVPLSLLQTVAKNAEQNIPRGLLLCGEHVTLMDGSTGCCAGGTCSMPDTPENQEHYPQPKSQKPGLGFPLRRFVVLISAAKEYDWPLNFGDIALLWRGGCIIRAVFLERIKEAFDTDANLENLLLNPYFKDIEAKSQDAWRNVIKTAIDLGTPVPAFMSALSYYDSYRSANLPANLLQAQRDYFGAHTYKRIDKPGEGPFHTDWIAEKRLQSEQKNQSTITFSPAS